VTDPSLNPYAQRVGGNILQDTPSLNYRADATMAGPGSGILSPYAGAGGNGTPPPSVSGTAYRELGLPTGPQKPMLPLAARGANPGLNHPSFPERLGTVSQYEGDSTGASWNGRDAFPANGARPFSSNPSAQGSQGGSVNLGGNAGVQGGSQNGSVNVGGSLGLRAGSQNGSVNGGGSAGYREGSSNGFRELRDSMLEPGFDEDIIDPDEVRQAGQGPSPTGIGVSVGVESFGLNNFAKAPRGSDQSLPTPLSQKQFIRKDSMTWASPAQDTRDVLTMPPGGMPGPPSAAIASRGTPLVDYPFSRQFSEGFVGETWQDTSPSNLPDPMMTGNSLAQISTASSMPPQTSNFPDAFEQKQSSKAEIAPAFGAGLTQKGESFLSAERVLSPPVPTTSASFLPRSYSACEFMDRQNGERRQQSPIIPESVASSMNMQRSYSAFLQPPESTGERRFPLIGGSPTVLESVSTPVLSGKVPRPATGLLTAYSAETFAPVSRMVSAEPFPPVSRMVCASAPTNDMCACGQVLTPDSAFCRMCGAKRLKVTESLIAPVVWAAPPLVSRSAPEVRRAPIMVKVSPVPTQRLPTEEARPLVFQPLGFEPPPTGMWKLPSYRISRMPAPSPLPVFRPATEVSPPLEPEPIVEPEEPPLSWTPNEVPDPHEPLMGA